MVDLPESARGQRQLGAQDTWCGNGDTRIDREMHGGVCDIACMCELGIDLSAYWRCLFRSFLVILYIVYRETSHVLKCANTSMGTAHLKLEFVTTVPEATHA